MDASSLGDRRGSSGHHVIVELAESGASPTGITPPPVPLLLSFADLTYVVKKQTNRLLRLPSPFIRRRTRLTPESSTAEPSRKVVLNSVSGDARDGGILAVLGASGAGKSTLIDALAHRISRQSLQGSITLNGESLEPRLLKSISAYVMQDDLLFPMLTVEETLMFSAEFRLPRSLPQPAKKARVQALIDQLGLRDAAHTVIGDEGHRGVSGGERRRVSIGVDIIHDPVILFLDEPTSGLDSTSAFMVVRVLQRIARSGSIVVMSVHQPSARVLALVDHLMVLSRGQVAYAGPTASLTDFFSEFGDPVPPNENPAEYALDLIRELEASPDGAVTLVEFHKSWRKTKDQAGGTNRSLTLKDAIAESISRGKLMSGARSEPLSVRAFANPFWVEMLVLTRRTSVNYGRMPGLFITRSATVIITGFILATLFWRLDKSQGGLRDRFGLMIIVMATVYYICTESLPVFMKERYIFMRETAHNTYRRSSYVLANSLSGLPSLVFLSLVFASMTFFAVGMAGGVQGFIFYLLTILAYFWAGTSLVTLVSGVVKHELMGHVVAMSALSYFQLFCGFFISRDRIPRYWIWLHYVSPNKYVYEAFMLNEFGGPAECFAAGGAACATTGADVLRQEGIGDHWFSKWDRLLVTVGWGVLYRILFYLSLSIGGKITRK